MISFNESLYGWGVCNIPMPRSTQDIFSDRRKNKGRLLGLNRRRQKELPGVLVSISGAVAHDVPWGQTLTVGIFALFSIAFIFLISTVLPDFAEDIPEPVDIMIKLMADTPEKVTRPVQKTSQTPVKSETVGERVQVMPKKTRIRPMREKIPLPARREPLPILRRERLPDERLPDVRIHHNLRKKPVPQDQRLVPRTSSLQQIKLPKDVAISSAATTQERYNHRDRILSEDQPLQMNSETGFISPDSAETSGVAMPSQQHQRKYEAAPQTQPVMISSSPTDLSSDTTELHIAADMTAKKSQKVYGLSVKEQPMMVVTENAGPLLASSKVPAADVAPASRSQKNYSAGVDDHETVVPAETSGPLLLQPDMPVANISPAEQSQKSYRVSRERRGEMMPITRSASMLPRTDVSAATVDAISRPRKSYDLNTVNPDQTDKAESRSVSFADINMNDIDPAHLIQLKELAVCADPEEEFRLKTKLAVLLMEPARCESNGMLLFFKYPESGYTIRVEIYNPGGLVLEDRCSVLQLAVDCIQDQKSKGVIP